MQDKEDVLLVKNLSFLYESQSKLEIVMKYHCFIHHQMQFKNPRFTYLIQFFSIRESEVDTTRENRNYYNIVESSLQNYQINPFKTTVYLYTRILV